MLDFPPLPGPHRPATAWLTFMTMLGLLTHAAGQVVWEPAGSMGAPSAMSLGVSPAGEVWINVATRYNPSGNVLGALPLKSTDSGASWNTAPAMGLPSVPILCFGFAADGGILAGVQNGGVYRLASSASNWTTTSGIGSVTVQSLARTAAGTLLAGTLNGIYRATGAGTSWQPSNTGNSSNDIRAFVSTAVAGEVIAATGTGIIRSTDDGASWAPFNPGLGNTNVRALLVLPSRRILAATAAGVFACDSIATGWSSASSGLTQTDVVAIARRGATVLAGTRGGGLFLSTNEGASWAATNTGLPSLLVTKLDATAAGFVVATNGGLARSATGSTWVRANPATEHGLVKSLFAVPGTNILLAGTVNNGIYRSADRGATWNSVGLPGAYAWDFAAAPNGDLFACINGSPALISNKLHRSTDAGLTWTPVNPGALISGGNSVKGIAFLPNGDGYCATFGSPSAVLRATNAYTDWATSVLSAKPAVSLSVSPAGDLYMGGETVGLWRGLGGTNWSEIGTFSAANGRNIYKVRFNSQGHLYVPSGGSGGRGIALCTQPAAASPSFTDLYTAGPVYCVATGSGSATWGGILTGVIYSPDGVTGWNAYGTGLPSQPVLDLTLGTDGRLYAATGGAGVWRTTLPVQTPTAPREAWRWSRFGSAFANSDISGDSADPDADGLSNLLEYAAGTDPLTPTSLAQPAERLVTVGGQRYLAITFRRAAAATDVTFTVRVADMLGIWTAGHAYTGAAVSADSGATVEVSRVAGDPELITVRDTVPVETAPLGRRYLSLQITAP